MGIPHPHILTVSCQVGKNLRWDLGLLSLKIMQWSDASFTGSKQVSSFVTSKIPDREKHSTSIG